jgi:hypothetical protein
MLRALLTLLVATILTGTLSADFVRGEPNDAYPFVARLSRGLFDPLSSSVQLHPKGRATLDGMMTKLIFEDLEFRFSETYREWFELSQPDPFTPPRIAVIHQEENPPYTLRVTEPLVFEVEYRWPLFPIWNVTSDYDTRDENGTPHPVLLTMVEVDPGAPKPDQITSWLEPVWQDGILVDYQAGLDFIYNSIPMDSRRFHLSSRLFSSIPAPGILPGDATRDTRFDSQDLVHLFQEGRYEQGTLVRPPSISLADSIEVARTKVDAFDDYNGRIDGG